MVIGGGLSILPHMAETLTEFVPVEDYLSWSEALLRVYDRQDEERKNLMKARIKFTLKRLGIEKIREMVAEELKKDWVKKPIDLDALTHLDESTGQRWKCLRPIVPLPLMMLLTICGNGQMLKNKGRKGSTWFTFALNAATCMPINGSLSQTLHAGLPVGG